MIINIENLINANISPIIGTTGFDDEKIEKVRNLSEKNNKLLDQQKESSQK